MLLAQFDTIQGILTRFVENLTVFHYFAALIGLALTIYIIAGARTHLALLLLFGVSLLTTAQSGEIASPAQLLRWYFLGLAALVALMRASPGDTWLLLGYGAYSAMNIVGIMYSPLIENALVRALFFILGIAAFQFSFGPRASTPESLVRFVRTLATFGVFLAAGHAIAIVVAPQATFLTRFKSFYTSPQTMSLATAAVTLPMLWLLISKNAGKWFWPMLLASLVNVTAMIASTQRAGIFSLGAAVVVILFFYRGRGAVIAIVCGLALAFIAYPIIKTVVSADFLAERFSTLDTTGRFEIWVVAWEQSLQSPIIGHGSGANTHYGEAVFGKKFHQAYLTVLYDFGFPGLAVFLSLIARGAWLALQQARNADPTRKALGVFLLAGLAQACLLGLMESSLADTLNETATLFYVSLGMLGGLTLMRPAPRGPVRYVWLQQPAVAAPPIIVAPAPGQGLP